MSDLKKIAIRKSENKKALIFIHGFGGDAYETFGMMPAFIAGNLTLTGWDLHSFGYDTELSPDITGAWAADPDLDNLSAYFAQTLCTGYNQYSELAIIAHSMGGLITQRALIDSECAGKVKHVMLFGTPSKGIWKTLLARMVKRQVRDMHPKSEFILNLRRDWDDKFANPQFTLDVIAGLRDQFVPPTSSLDCFDERHHVRVNGNHVEMVKPATSETDSVDWVIKRLLGQLDLAEALSHESDSEFESLPPEDTYSSDTDEKLIINRALVLEMAGRQEEAINLLEKYAPLDSDIMGTLAGRYKRRFMRDPDNNESDGQVAFDHYMKGFEGAKKPEIAAYNVINAAFMHLALHSAEEGDAWLKSKKEARELAQKAEALTAKVKDDPWHLATKAEAYLHENRDEDALETYKKAIEKLDGRERASMFQQAIWTVRLLEKELLESQLEALLVTRT